MKALITGITGQDGSYLAEHLLSLGYEVHGIVRRASTPNTCNLKGVEDSITLHFGDLTDAGSIDHIVSEVQPDELYNLAAQSHVAVSFKVPQYTVNVGTCGTLNVLEAVRRVGKLSCRVYQASSSEMFGSSPPLQNEETPLVPLSPYACAKVFGFNLCHNYRVAYNMFISNGILFNHESPRRGETFVTRKISLAAARIKFGKQDKLYLGNLDAKRDWGYAPEYVRAMHMMLQADGPDDYVVATGEQHTVREFVQEIFSHVDLNWEDHVEVSGDFMRPSEVIDLCGDASKIKSKIGWEHEVTFSQLCQKMVEHDVNMERDY